MTAYENELANLPRPEPPPDLAAVVLARIARIEEAAAAPSSTHTPGAWSAWATALGAVAAAIALLVSAPVEGDLLSGIRITRDAVIGGFVLATSLVIYLIGLFGMVRSR